MTDTAPPLTPSAPLSYEDALDHARRVYPTLYYPILNQRLDEIAAHVSSLESRCAALQADAVRMDWMEENRYSGAEVDGFRIGYALDTQVKDLTDDCRDAPPLTLREVVDAARAVSPEKPYAVS
jgi:hypothetical protein